MWKTWTSRSLRLAYGEVSVLYVRQTAHQQQRRLSYPLLQNVLCRYAVQIGVNVLQCPLMSLVFDWFRSCYIGSLSICVHGGDENNHYLYGLLLLFIEFPLCYVLFISVINIIQAY